MVSCVGQPANVGQPWVSWVPKGRPSRSRLPVTSRLPSAPCSLGVLAERLLDSGRVERLSGDHPTARALIGGDVHVHVGPAAHGAVGVGPGERTPAGAGLRVVGPGRGREGEPRKGAGDGARTEDPEHRTVR